MQKEVSRFSGKGPIEDWLSDTATIESPWMPNVPSPQPHWEEIHIDELDEAVDVLKEFGGREEDKSL